MKLFAIIFAAIVAAVLLFVATGFVLLKLEEQSQSRIAAVRSTAEYMAYKAERLNRDQSAEIDERWVESVAAAAAYAADEQSSREGREASDRLQEAVESLAKALERSPFTDQKKLAQRLREALQAK